MLFFEVDEKTLKGKIIIWEKYFFTIEEYPATGIITNNFH